MATISDLCSVRDSIVSRYLGKATGANVVGVGIGDKYVAGLKTGYQCVRVYVSRKPGLNDLAARDLIPARIGNVDTDVIDVGIEFTPNGGRRRKPDTPADTCKPARGEPGSSIGLPAEATRHLGRLVSGTLGAILEGENGKRYVIGCNHVLSVNGLVKKDEAKIVTPAPQDREQGEEEEVIAKAPLVVPLRSYKPNLVDCAAAETSLPVNTRFCRNGKKFDLEGLRPPVGGLRVFKLGKGSGLTYGTIVDISADILVDYSFGGFHFTSQVLIQGDNDRDFASDGDSGAIVLADVEKPYAVAMVFAPAGKYTAACPMEEVKKSLLALMRDDPAQSPKPVPPAERFDLVPRSDRQPRGKAV